MTVVAVLAALALGLLLGVALERRQRRTLVADAATATVDELVARQASDDRRAVYSMPPGIEAGDAIELSARHGISVREAALVLFRAQARARIDGNLRRDHRPTTANRSKRP